ncbi:MAG: hypothetical protein K2K90_17915 [Lachnospiraceae bacterium]|nr:hypothetical protein [Lachnospiraceae bacterium]
MGGLGNAVWALPSGSLPGPLRFHTAFMCNMYLCDPSALRHNTVKPSIQTSVNFSIWVHSQNYMNQPVLHHVLTLTAGNASTYAESYPCSFFSACDSLYNCSILLAPFRAVEL